jgi:hypothetical protein
MNNTQSTLRTYMSHRPAHMSGFRKSGAGLKGAHVNEQHTLCDAKQNPASHAQWLLYPHPAYVWR